MNRLQISIHRYIHPFPPTKTTHTLLTSHFQFVFPIQPHRVQDEKPKIDPGRRKRKFSPTMRKVKEEKECYKLLLSSQSLKGSFLRYCCFVYFLMTGEFLVTCFPNEKTQQLLTLLSSIIINDWKFSSQTDQQCVCFVQLSILTFP